MFVSSTIRTGGVYLFFDQVHDFPLIEDGGALFDTADRSNRTQDTKNRRTDIFGRQIGAVRVARRNARTLGMG